MNKNSLAVFEDYKIRRVYDKESETWYFSVVDIIQVLIQQSNYQAARNYWKVLKNRLNKEGSETVTKCNWLKLESADGKKSIHTYPAYLVIKGKLDYCIKSYNLVQKEINYRSNSICSEKNR